MTWGPSRTACGASVLRQILRSSWQATSPATGWSASRVLREIWAILDRRDRLSVSALLAGMVVGAAWEAVGISSLMPFVAVLNRPSIAGEYAVGRRLMALTGSTSASS